MGLLLVLSFQKAANFLNVCYPKPQRIYSSFDTLSVHQRRKWKVFLILWRRPSLRRFLVLFFSFRFDFLHITGSLLVTCSFGVRLKTLIVAGSTRHPLASGVYSSRDSLKTAHSWKNTTCSTHTACTYVVRPYRRQSNSTRINALFNKKQPSWRPPPRALSLGGKSWPWKERTRSPHPLAENNNDIGRMYFYPWCLRQRDTTK